MSCYLCNLKELKVGQTVGGREAEKTPMLPSGSRGVRMLWPGRQVPLNVYEQNICGRIPQRRGGEGRWEARSKKSNVSTFRKGILRSESFTRYWMDVGCLFCFGVFLLLPFLSTFIIFNSEQAEFVLRFADDESKKATIKSQNYEILLIRLFSWNSRNATSGTTLQPKHVTSAWRTYRSGGVAVREWHNYKCGRKTCGLRAQWALLLLMFSFHFPLTGSATIGRTRAFTEKRSFSVSVIYKYG